MALTANTDANTLIQDLVFRDYKQENENTNCYLNIFLLKRANT